MCFITEEAKETILDFSQGTLKLLWMSSYDLTTACFTILFFTLIRYQYKMTQYNTQYDSV